MPVFVEMAYRADTAGDKTWLRNLRTRFQATLDTQANLGWTISGCRVQNGTTNETIQNTVFATEADRRDYNLARSFFCLPDEGLVDAKQIRKREGIPQILRTASLNGINGTSNTQIQNIELSNQLEYRQERFVSPNTSVYPPKLPVYYI